MGPKTKDFIKKFNYIFISSFCASIFTYVLFILAARFLGPEEYGKYNLILALSTFLIWPMSWGFNFAAIKYLSENKSRKEIISTAACSVLVFIGVSSILIHIFRNPLSALVKIDPVMFNYLFLFSIIVAIHYTLLSFLKGLYALKELAILRVIIAILTGLLLIFFLFIQEKYTFVSPIMASIISYAVYALLLALLLRKYFVLKFSYELFCNLFKYGKYVIVSDAASIFLSNIDKILINIFLNSSQVGIYSAYYMASTVIINKMLDIFLTVFFPAASRYENKKALFLKLLRVSKKIFCLLLIFNIIITSVLVKLYGPKYALHGGLIFMFAFSSVLYAITNSGLLFLCSIGTSGIRINAIQAVFVAGLNILLNIVLIPILNLYGAVISTIISNLCSLIFLNIYLKRVLNINHKKE